MSERTGRTPLVLVVDVEPDEHVFPPHAPSSWDAFPLLVANLTALRAQLEDRTGNPVAFAWSLRMDPQIAFGYGSPTFVVDRYGDLVDTLLAAGDEIGIHPHAWRWQERESEWVSDHASQAWLDECLDTSAEAYRSAFGRPPSHHRFGAGLMNSAIMRRIGHHGIPIDLTLEPGEMSVRDGRRHGGRFVGGTGDFREIPRGLYRPDAGDFRVSASDDAAGPLAIPMTSGTFRRSPSSLRHQGRHPAITARHALGDLRNTAMRVRGRGGYELLAMWKDWRPADFWDAAWDAADQVSPRYLSFAVRSTSGFADSGEGQRFDAVMQQLLVDPRTRDLHFMTPAHAAAELGQTASR